MLIFLNNRIPADSQPTFKGNIPAHGFTLVEVLVVMLLIGLSLGIIFRIDYSSGPQRVENAANEFAGTAELILQEAVLGGDFWGIDFFTETSDTGTAYGYRWLHRKDDIWLQDMPAGLIDFPQVHLLDEGLSVQLEIEGQSLKINSKVDIQDSTRIPEDFSPAIWLYPNHESTAFTAIFLGAEDTRKVIKSDILGRIRIVTQDNES